jgi:hypothetical protein
MSKNFWDIYNNINEDNLGGGMGGDPANMGAPMGGPPMGGGIGGDPMGGGMGGPPMGGGMGGPPMGGGMGGPPMGGDPMGGGMDPTQQAPKQQINLKSKDVWSVWAAILDGSMKSEKKSVPNQESPNNDNQQQDINI